MKYTSTSIRLLLILLMIPVFSYGQSNNSTKKWELGMDLLWLIDKQRQPAKTLFLRVNQLDKKKAWRFRVGVDGTTIESSPNATPGDDDYKNFSPFLAIGHEWQKEIADKTTFYYGFDIGSRFTKTSWNIPFTDGYRSSQIEAEEWYLLTSPLIGFKYQVLDWLYISLESSLRYSYSTRTQVSKVVSNTPPNDLLSQHEDYRKVSDLSFLPFSVVHLSFYFP